MDNKIILRGIVGSTAYGLAGPDSDVDRLGVYIAPSMDFWGFNPPNGKSASKVTVKPDMTYHEIGKFMALCLKSNPTVTELLWLPDDLYEIRHPEYTEPLFTYRKCFLSAKNVRNAYLGYATQQFVRLEDRGDGSFSSDTRKRTAKHARHLWRLLYQGTILYQEGHLPIRLPEFQANNCKNFGEAVASGYSGTLAKKVLERAETEFSGKSALPDEPNYRLMEGILLDLRMDSFDKYDYSEMEDLK